MKKIIKEWQGVILILVALISFGIFNRAQAASDTWEPVGLAGFSTANAPYINLALDPLSGEPYVVYADGANAYEATVMKFNGSSWIPVGNAGIYAGGVSNTSIAFNPLTKEPYISYQDQANKVSVLRFDGSSWEPVGNVDFSIGNQAFNPSLAFDPSTNQPFVAYVDGGYPPVEGEDGRPDLTNPGINNRIVVMKFDGLVWSSISGAGFSPGSGDPKLAFNHSTKELYVAYFDGDHGQKLTVRRYDGSIWIPIGTAGEINEQMAGRMDFAFNPLTDEPYIAYLDGANSYKITVKRYDGSSWIAVGNQGVGAGYPVMLDLAFNASNGQPYVAYQDGHNSYRPTVITFNASTWVPVGDGGFNASNPYAISIAINPKTSQPYVAYLDGTNSNKATLMKFGSDVPVEEPCSMLDLDANFDNYDFPIKENLVVITHGVGGSAYDRQNPDNPSWVAGARRDMCNKINRADTTIATYDWTYGANTNLNAIQAYNNATPEGHYLAQKIKIFALNYLFSGKNFNSIHLIAHSAGSNVIQTAIDDLSDYYVNKSNKPFVHMTFLDAYVYDNAENRYGELHSFPGYAEQYVNMSTDINIPPHDLPFTNYKLTHATNFNVTDLPVSTKRHEWPIDVYRSSINNPSYKIGFVFAKENKEHYTERDDDFIGHMCKVNDANNDFNSCNEIDGDKARIVLDDAVNGYSFETISIQEVKIDIDAFIENNKPLPQIELISKLPSEEKLVSISIPAGTNIVSSPSNWDNTITAPKETFIKDGWWPWADVKAIEVGFSGGKLSFDKAVRIEFPGRAGKEARYSRDGGESTEITRICSSDTQISGDVLPFDGDCKMNVGNDLVIWTKHFTIFATYSPDETAPEITIKTPVDGEKYILNSKINSDWSATDALSGVATATGTVAPGNLIDTSSIGQKEFKVTATDKAGNSITKTIKYDVVYAFGGFQNPTTKDKTFNGNSTIPLKFKLTDASGNSVSIAVASLEVGGKPAVADGNSNSGNSFKYDASGSQYIFNLSLKNTSLGTGAHTLKVTLDDGTTYTLGITVK